MEDYDAVTVLLHDAVRSGLIPGFVACAGIGEDILYQSYGGYAQLLGETRRMQPNTMFDVASLTKVMATLPAFLLLMTKGCLSPDTPISHYFPQYAEGEKKRVRVGHLLSHTAGLVAPQPLLWQQFSCRSEIVDAALNQPIKNEPGAMVHYSDVGYIILGELIQQETGVPLDTWTREHIFIPCGMCNTGYNPTNIENIAATEGHGGNAMTGIVHDKTARSMGGVAGHAGLFSTGSDIAHYLMLWTGKPHLIHDVLLDQSIVPKYSRTNGNRGWGWALHGDRQDISGDGWPHTVASHTGFTGTSVLFDRPSRVWACLLTNRVLLGRTVNIGPLRRAYHTALGRILFR